jgi:hypothetical protein
MRLIMIKALIPSKVTLISIDLELKSDSLMKHFQIANYLKTFQAFHVCD